MTHRWNPTFLSQPWPLYWPAEVGYAWANLENMSVTTSTLSQPVRHPLNVQVFGHTALASVQRLQFWQYLVILLYIKGQKHVTKVVVRSIPWCAWSSWRPWRTSACKHWGNSNWSRTCPPLGVCICQYNTPSCDFIQIHCCTTFFFFLTPLPALTMCWFVGGFPLS